ncbi:MAG TPA: hypothetical protein VEA99_02440 [Gemmatimonadaceae bacterium]|nr:hypothetical protein [Gemmatimonadaceae bacterium]
MPASAPTSLADGFFDPLIGLPAWMVRRGHGSFITMEFGEPHLQIGQVEEKRLHIAGAPERAAGRFTKFGGRWHLWVYCCDWHLELDGVELAHNETDDVTMNRALGFLDGQQLHEVHINPADAATTFTFDLGCILHTRPAPPGLYKDPPVEQWFLYEWDGDVLVVREDGTFTHGPGSLRSADEIWRPLG